ncbi:MULTISPECIES: ABC1 kinase family protein [unclassified Sporolactobacillus]|uniref:ABC1 kinase family protein n=1 Tax=unclassified Sporolactobacillus TaxID=2628533 RepID=UPI002368C8F2|nr:AarF/UbiB family protein [Sporolactobacillus sp. CQH2019]MDD9149556.1 AarF/UbiB family protein [Sporolactobacillus sp. CQH2019]
MFGKRIRHIKRYREIVTVLVKYGFGYIVKDVGLFHLLSLPKQIVSDFSGTNDSKPVGRKIRLMLEELGPTFIKLGQLLSLRSDLIPEQIANELRELQDSVTPIDPAVIKSVIRQELGAPVGDIFADFDEQCLAAASIAQAHRAVLKTGEEVVIKVRRPDIETVVSTDIEILWDLAALVEKRYSWAKKFQISDIVEEFSLAIRNEMDYFREGRNTEKLYNYFASNENIIIPKVYWDYSTNKLLTLEYINGAKYADLIASVPEGIDKKIISERLVRSFLDQALVVGVFHGDPHPGNLFFFPGNKIGYIDFGQVGTLNEEMKHNFASLIIGLMRGDIDLLFRTIFLMSSMPEDLDERLFKADLELMRDKYYELPFKEIHIGKVIQDIFETTKKHHISIPKDYTLLGKALITLEGLITRLDNQISILELAEPYGQKLLLNRYNPERVAKKTLKSVYEALENSAQIPSLLKKTLTHLYKGKTHVEMELPHLDLLLSRLDRVANRISFSIMLLAFSIILGAMIIGETFGAHPLFTNIPLLDIAVMIVALMFLLVLLAIFRSGRF